MSHNQNLPAEDTFWGHLDALRASLFKIVVAIFAFFIIAFCFKDELFDFILAPKNDDFILYRAINAVTQHFGGKPLDGFKVELINTGLAAQLLIHMKMAFMMAVFLTSPYILYELFAFISPALYASERKYTVRIVFGAYIMFLLGATVSYLLIFPIAFRFLGTYQVAADVTNMISLESYTDVLMSLSLTLGVVFELPILCWLLAKLGFLSASFMQRYRRHAIVIIVIMAAFITPPDVFTLTAVSIPIYALYEFSIRLVRHTRSIPRDEAELAEEEAQEDD